MMVAERLASELLDGKTEERQKINEIKRINN